MYVCVCLCGTLAYVYTHVRHTRVVGSTRKGGPVWVLERKGCGRYTWSCGTPRMKEVTREEIERGREGEKREKRHVTPCTVLHSLLESFWPNLTYPRWDLSGGFTCHQLHQPPWCTFLAVSAYYPGIPAFPFSFPIPVLVNSPPLSPPWVSSTHRFGSRNLGLSVRIERAPTT